MCGFAYFLLDLFLERNALFIILIVQYFLLLTLGIVGIGFGFGLEILVLFTSLIPTPLSPRTFAVFLKVAFRSTLVPHCMGTSLSSNTRQST